MAKLVTVFGATGKQGGSVLRALAADPAFKVRAVSRDPSSSSSKALAALGAEVVKGDFFDKNTIESAVSGAHGCFLVTDYFKSFNKDEEIRQGKNVVDAVKAAGVKHMIYSGLEDVKKTMGVDCPHFDSKAAVERYIEEQGLAYTFVRMAFYLENFNKDMMLNKTEHGYIVAVPMPETPCDVLSVAECGECVRAVFKQPDRFMGKKIGLSCDKITTDRMAELFNKHLAPLKFINPKITTEQYAQFPFPLAKEFAAMFDFYNRGNPDRDVALTKELNPKLSDAETWIKNNKDKITKDLEG